MHQAQVVADKLNGAVITKKKENRMGGGRRYAGVKREREKGQKEKGATQGLRKGAVEARKTFPPKREKGFGHFLRVIWGGIE